MKKAICKVTKSERDEILALNERHNGLVELAMILPVNDAELYEKYVNDLAQTSEKSSIWWQSMSEKYQLESSDSGHWEIDFDEGTIFLVTPDVGE